MTPFKQSVKRFTQAIQKQKIESYVIKKQFEDISFDFIIGDTEAKDWYDSELSSSTPESLNPEPLNHEFKFIRQLIEPGDIVFECGTHHGLTAMLLSKWVGTTGQIVTFEINQKNAAIARQNIALNEVENVILEEKGLGSQNNRLKIFDKSNASVTPSNLLSFGWLKNFVYGTNEAEITTLDDYAKITSLMPTFLKIDVEGYEAEVLKGASEILKTRPKLEIEIHTEILSRYNTSVAEIFDLIEPEGYQMWLQWHDDEEPQYFDWQQHKTIDHRVHLFAIPQA
ncbi:MAG: FkbM family methyltransferase [Cyanobacteria bacterium J06623_7]